jgi:hypothetical protein
MGIKYIGKYAIEHDLATCAGVYVPELLRVYGG